MTWAGRNVLVGGSTIVCQAMVSSLVADPKKLSEWVYTKKSAKYVTHTLIETEEFLNVNAQSIIKVAQDRWRQG